MINTSESLRAFLHRELKNIKGMRQAKEPSINRELSFYVDGVEAGFLMVLKKNNTTINLKK